MSYSEENFLKTVYLENKQPGEAIQLSTVAELLGVSNAAVTEMARKLADKKLVNYIRYKPLTLTKEGQNLALKAIRKHRIWETFLFRTLHLSLFEIHREAEQLEHLTSEFLIEKIDQFLGEPTVDPHGDPIPVADGTVNQDRTQIPLLNAEAGKSYVVSRLFSSEEDFFEFCLLNGIGVGTTVLVIKQYDQKKLTHIKIEHNSILLNKEFSGFIYVKQYN
jgi:DtxR family Mn-dependent transcriptional regulator